MVVSFPEGYLGKLSTDCSLATSGELRCRLSETSNRLCVLSVLSICGNLMII